MEVTYDQLAKIQRALNSVPTEEIKDKVKTPINDKLSWAIKRFIDKNERVFKSFSNGEIDINRDNASVDEKGNFLLTASGGLSFTPAAQRKVSEAFDRYMREGRVEIEPYVCKDLTRSSTLPLWVQVDLDEIVLMLDPKIKAFIDDDTNREEDD